jgi:hypothetical protein
MVRPLLAELYCSRDTGRDDGHFVDPVDQLKETVDIQEPTNRESREELHLDHDIQGMTGSPELARAILNKIDASQVVVADVTLVGRRPDANAADTTIPRDGLINSNVAIELGYALRAVSDSNVLMVFNLHHGRHEDLPFDLRHRGGTIDFGLPPDAERERIEEHKKKLRERFVVELRPFLGSRHPNP